MTPSMTQHCRWRDSTETQNRRSTQANCVHGTSTPVTHNIGILGPPRPRIVYWAAPFLNCLASIVISAEARRTCSQGSRTPGSRTPGSPPRTNELLRRAVAGEGTGRIVVFVTWELAPGCRFAGRIIERTSGILANVWSPDAVNDAGGRDGCAIFVVPRRHGRSSEHGRSDQCCRNELIHLRLL